MRLVFVCVEGSKTCFNRQLASRLERLVQSVDEFVQFSPNFHHFFPLFADTSNYLHFSRTLQAPQLHDRHLETICLLRPAAHSRQSAAADCLPRDCLDAADLRVGAEQPRTLQKSINEEQRPINGHFGQMIFRVCFPFQPHSSGRFCS